MGLEKISNELKVLTPTENTDAAPLFLLARHQVEVLTYVLADITGCFTDFLVVCLRDYNAIFLHSININVSVFF